MLRVLLERLPLPLPPSRAASASSAAACAAPKRSPSPPLTAATATAAAAAAAATDAADVACASPPKTGVCVMVGALGSAGYISLSSRYVCSTFVWSGSQKSKIVSQKQCPISEEN